MAIGSDKSKIKSQDRNQRPEPHTESPGKRSIFFKLKVAQDVCLHHLPVKAAARKYNVDAKCVREFRSQFEAGLLTVHSDDFTKVPASRCHARETKPRSQPSIATLFKKEMSREPASEQSEQMQQEVYPLFKSIPKKALHKPAEIPSTKQQRAGHQSSKRKTRTAPSTSVSTENMVSPEQKKSKELLQQILTELGSCGESSEDEGSNLSKTVVVAPESTALSLPENESNSDFEDPKKTRGVVHVLDREGPKKKRGNKSSTASEAPDAKTEKPQGLIAALTTLQDYHEGKTVYPLFIKRPVVSGQEEHQPTQEVAHHCTSTSSKKKNINRKGADKSNDTSQNYQSAPESCSNTGKGLGEVSLEEREKLISMLKQSVSEAIEMDAGRRSTETLQSEQIEPPQSSKEGKGAKVTAVSSKESDTLLEQSVQESNDIDGEILRNETPVNAVSNTTSLPSQQQDTKANVTEQKINISEAKGIDVESSTKKSKRNSALKTEQKLQEAAAAPNDQPDKEQNLRRSKRASKGIGSYFGKESEELDKDENNQFIEGKTKKSKLKQDKQQTDIKNEAQISGKRKRPEPKTEPQQIIDVDEEIDKNAKAGRGKSAKVKYSELNDDQLLTANKLFLNKLQLLRRQELEMKAALQEKIRRTKELDLLHFGKLAAAHLSVSGSSSSAPLETTLAGPTAAAFFAERAPVKKTSSSARTESCSIWQQSSAGFPVPSHILSQAEQFDWSGTVCKKSQTSVMAAYFKAASTATCNNQKTLSSDRNSEMELISTGTAREREPRFTNFLMDYFEAAEGSDSVGYDAVLEAARSCGIIRMDEGVEGSHDRVEADYDAVTLIKQKQPNNLQWIDKYKPSPTWKVCGNAMVKHNLEQFLKEWKEIREHEIQRWLEYDYYDSEEEETSACNHYLIEGPTGVGKTALIQLCASKLGYEIIEINTSQVRSSASIKKLFGEATQSQRISMKKDFLDTEKRDKPKDQKRSKKLKRSDTPPVDMKKLTLILIEDVDVILEEDVAFHTAIRDLIKTAKCPIILTSQAKSGAHSELVNQKLEMKQLSWKQIAYILSLITSAEEVDIPLKRLNAIAKSSLSDLRASIMVLQSASKRLQNVAHGTQQFHRFLQSSLNKQTSETASSLFLAQHLPIVRFLRPGTGEMKGGETVTIHGSNLHLQLPKYKEVPPKVCIGGQWCEAQFVGPNAISFVLPAANSPGPVEVVVQVNGFRRSDTSLKLRFSILFNYKDADSPLPWMFKPKRLLKARHDDRMATSSSDFSDEETLKEMETEFQETQDAELPTVQISDENQMSIGNYTSNKQSTGKRRAIEDSDSDFETSQPLSRRGTATCDVAEPVNSEQDMHITQESGDTTVLKKHESLSIQIENNSSAEGDIRTVEDENIKECSPSTIGQHSTPEVELPDTCNLSQQSSGLGSNRSRLEYSGQDTMQSRSEPSSTQEHQSMHTHSPSPKDNQSTHTPLLIQQTKAQGVSQYTQDTGIISKIPPQKENKETQEKICQDQFDCIPVESETALSHMQSDLENEMVGGFPTNAGCSETDVLLSPDIPLDDMLTSHRALEDLHSLYESFSFASTFEASHQSSLKTQHQDDVWAFGSQESYSNSIRQAAWRVHEASLFSMKASQECKDTSNSFQEFNKFSLATEHDFWTKFSPHCSKLQMQVLRSSSLHCLRNFGASENCPESFLDYYPFLKVTNMIEESKQNDKFKRKRRNTHYLAMHGIMEMDQIDNMKRIQEEAIYDL